jgi:predicted glycosyltransferase
MPHALLYVQHLLGIGHLVRTVRIGMALRNAGARTTLVLGGTPPDGLIPQDMPVVRLDPVHVAPSRMDQLLGADRRPFDVVRQAARRDRLLHVFADLHPDILLIEAFPFGRRQLRFELLPLLARAQAVGTPVVASSVRDILQERRRPGRDEETCATIERWFHLVLVHGEEFLTPLALTFPLADRLRDFVRYTGMVGPPVPAAPVPGHDVVVHAGGGAVGGALLRAAMHALALPEFRGLTALVLTGPNLPPDEAAALRAQGSPSVLVHPFVHDLPARLLAARLSISQAGYNTVAELLATGCPAVLVPFMEGNETEQMRRATAMQEAGRAIVHGAVDPGGIAGAIRAGLALPRRPPVSGLDGAARSAALLLARLAQARSRAAAST